MPSPTKTSYYLLHKAGSRTFYQHVRDGKDTLGHTVKIFVRIATGQGPLVVLTDVDYNCSEQFPETGSRIHATPTPPEPGLQYVHDKTQTAYEALGSATLQTDVSLKDMARMVVYKGPDHRLWVRPIEEFNDKFTPVG